MHSQQKLNHPFPTQKPTVFIMHSQPVFEISADWNPWVTLIFGPKARFSHEPFLDDFRHFLGAKKGLPLDVAQRVNWAACAGEGEFHALARQVRIWTLEPIGLIKNPRSTQGHLPFLEKFRSAQTSTNGLKSDN